MVPLDQPPSLTFHALITGGGSPVVFNVPGASSVARFTLGNDLTLTINPGCTLSVSQEAALCGILASTGGTMVLDGSSFSCDRARAYVSGGGRVTIAGAATYSGGGLGAAALLSADGQGSRLEFPDLTDITDVWAHGSFGLAHTIAATAGGTIDLSGLESIAGPADNERLVLVAHTGGQLDLSSLATTTATTEGAVDFEVGPGSSVLLPAIESLDRTRFFVSGGGQLHAAGAAPATLSAGGTAYQTTIMLADGPGSVLDLRALSVISDVWGHGSFGLTHTIAATDGGQIDLRNVHTISGPADNERLVIRAEGGGGIDLSSMATTAATTEGAIDFEVGAGSSIFLPAIQSLDRTRFFVFAGGQVHAQGSTPANLSTGGTAYATTVMSAAGAGSVLDLRALGTLSDVWGHGSFGLAHTIAAEDGGQIDLRNVHTITGPADNERLVIRAQGGGSLDLSSLAATTATVDGAIDFEVGPGSSVLLPAIQSLDSTRFFAFGGGEVHAVGPGPASLATGGVGYQTTVMSADGEGSVLDLRALTAISDVWGHGSFGLTHTIAATAGGHIDLRNVQTITGPADNERLIIRAEVGGAIDLSALATTAATTQGAIDFEVDSGGEIHLPAVQALGSTRFFVSGGGRVHATGASPATLSPGGVAYQTTILAADGPGSLLDLNAVTALNDSWSHGSFGLTHTIVATSSAHLSLGGLGDITGPGDNERLVLLVGSGATLTLGSPRAVAGNSPSISLTGAGSRLSVLGTLYLGRVDPAPALPRLSIDAGEGTTVSVGQDLVCTHVDPALASLDRATLHFNGTGQQRAEAAGLDLGPTPGAVCALSSGNFGFHRLVVGQPGQPTVLRVADQVDNGNRSPGRPEALYLWGSFERAVPPVTLCAPGPTQVDGLQLHPGSTLALDSVRVYTFNQGQWLDLDCLLSGTVRSAPFSGGTVQGSPCYPNCDDSTAAPALNVADFSCFLTRYAAGRCYANCDGSTTPPVLNVQDFGCFLTLYAQGCP